MEFFVLVNRRTFCFYPPSFSLYHTHSLGFLPLRIASRLVYWLISALWLSVLWDIGSHLSILWHLFLGRYLLAPQNGGAFTICCSLLGVLWPLKGKCRYFHRVLRLNIFTRQLASIGVMALGFALVSTLDNSVIHVYWFSDQGPNELSVNLKEAIRPIYQNLDRSRAYLGTILHYRATSFYWTWKPLYYRDSRRCRYTNHDNRQETAFPPKEGTCICIVTCMILTTSR